MKRKLLKKKFSNDFFKLYSEIFYLFVWRGRKTRPRVYGVYEILHDPSGEYDAVFP